MKLSWLMTVAMCFCLFIGMPAFSQDKESGLGNVINFPSNLFTTVNKKATRLEECLSIQTGRYLQRLAKKEKKLQCKLFAGSQQQYAELTGKIKGKSYKLKTGLRGEYLPGIDSLKTSLPFLVKKQPIAGRHQRRPAKGTGDVGQFKRTAIQTAANQTGKSFYQIMQVMDQGGLRQVHRSAQGNHQQRS